MFCECRTQCRCDRLVVFCECRTQCRCDRLVVFQLIRSLERAYVISAANRDDINKLLKSLGTVRSLLSVQVCSDEEEILKNSIWSVLTVTDLYII